MLHINQLELLAVIKVFKAFRDHLAGKMVQITTDNVTTMYYILKQGGSHSPSCLYFTVDLWEWCLSHHICPTALHIPSQDKSLADLLSRKEFQAHKWESDQTAFLLLCKHWGMPTINLFSPGQIGSANVTAPMQESISTHVEMHL